MAIQVTTYGDVLTEEFEELNKNLIQYNVENCYKSNRELLKGAREIANKTATIIYGQLGIKVEFPNLGVRHGIIKLGYPIFSTQEGKTLRIWDIWKSPVRSYKTITARYRDDFIIIPRPLGMFENSRIPNRDMW